MHSSALAQHQLVESFENRVKWTVARAYRDLMHDGVPEHEARWAAIQTLEHLQPELTPEQTQAATAFIIVRAARDHKAWMRGGE